MRLSRFLRIRFIREHLLIGFPHFEITNLVVIKFSLSCIEIRFNYEMVKYLLKELLELKLLNMSRKSRLYRENLMAVDINLA